MRARRSDSKITEEPSEGLWDVSSGLEHRIRTASEPTNTHTFVRVCYTGHIRVCIQKFKKRKGSKYVPGKKKVPSE